MKNKKMRAANKAHQNKKRNIALVGLIAVLSIAVFSAFGVDYSHIPYLGAHIIGTGTVSFAMALPVFMVGEKFKELSADELVIFQKDATVEQLAEYYTAKNAHDRAELQKMIEAKATKEDISSLMDEIKQNQADQMKTLNEVLKQHGLAIQKMTTKELFDNHNVITNVKDFVKSIKLADKLKEKKNGFDVLEIKAAALMTVANNIVTADGYSVNVNNYIDAEIGSVPKPKNFILTLITVENQEGTEKIWWSERNTEEGNAEFIGEGDLKPLVSAKYETKSADIKEVAERWKMSNRMVMHTNRVVADFNEHANELMDQEIDTKILLGDGTGDELLGIAAQASAFIAPTSLIAYYVDPNIWDVINAVIAQISLANFTPTDVVLNTVERAKMFGIKDSQGRYLIPPFMMPDGREFAGLHVTFTNKMPDGKILVGDLSKFKVVFSETVKYYTGWENDDFSKNLTSAKLEAFLGTYLKTPYVPAIVYDDIATIKTAIGTV